MFFSHRLLFLISMPILFLLASFSSLYLYKLYIFCFSSLYSDEELTSETSVFSLFYGVEVTFLLLNYNRLHLYNGNCKTNRKFKQTEILE